MKLLITAALAAITITSCKAKNKMDNHHSADTAVYTYLALGDSYTIGESVTETDNFPNRLTQQIKTVKSPVIIARTGWTTGELTAAINESDTKGHIYDIVTLLIGVNNQFRGYSQSAYRMEFAKLLNTAITYANGKKDHVFVLSIPDWGVTPYAEGHDRKEIATEINLFNAINKQETDKAGVAYIDITPISRQAAADPGLTASDGLHPSAAMYKLWVEKLTPMVKSVLK